MTLLERTAGTTLVLTIDRPEAKNAINHELALALRDAVLGAGSHPTLRAIVLTAQDPEVFVAGGDLKEFRTLELNEAGAQHIIDFGIELGCIEQCPLPVIAAITGQVLGGGCELLVLCDLAVMEDHTTIEFRHAKMGLTPAWGGTSRLIERVGSLHATDLLLTARPVPAPEAQTLGLVNRVVPRGEALGAALALADQISHSSRDAVAAIKRSLVEARQAQRADALQRERDIFRHAWGSESHQAAMKAFLKRHGGR